MQNFSPQISSENYFSRSQSQRNSTPFRAPSPATSFSRLLLSQDEQPTPLNDITPNAQNQVNAGIKKMKKTRLLLDPRTELTDDELKASMVPHLQTSWNYDGWFFWWRKTARAQYLQAQDQLRRELEQKQSEKHCGRILEEKVWGVPSCSASYPATEMGSI